MARFTALVAVAAVVSTVGLRPPRWDDSGEAKSIVEDVLTFGQLAASSTLSGPQSLQILNKARIFVQRAWIPDPQLLNRAIHALQIHHIGQIDKADGGTMDWFRTGSWFLNETGANFHLPNATKAGLEKFSQEAHDYMVKKTGSGLAKLSKRFLEECGEEASYQELVDFVHRVVNEYRGRMLTTLSGIMTMVQWKILSLQVQALRTSSSNIKHIVRDVAIFHRHKMHGDKWQEWFNNAEELRKIQVEFRSLWLRVEDEFKTNLVLRYQTAAMGALATGQVWRASVALFQASWSYTSAIDAVILVGNALFIPQHVKVFTDATKNVEALIALHSNLTSVAAETDLDAPSELPWDIEVLWEVFTEAITQPLHNFLAALPGQGNSETDIDDLEM